jgi:hypothetical protein
MVAGLPSLRELLLLPRRKHSKPIMVVSIKKKIRARQRPPLHLR